MRFFQRKFWIIICLLLLISCKQAKLTDARDQYIRGEYYSASETYSKLYNQSRDKDSAVRGVIAFEMAEVYRKLNRSSRAVNAYKNAIRFEYPDSLIYLRYAQMLHKEGEYEQAIEAYNKFLRLSPDHQLANNGLKGAKLSMSWQEANTNVVNITYSELFNSNRGEFSPTLAHNDNVLYFNSSRNDAIGYNNSPITGVKYNDLYISEKSVTGEWQKPKRLSSEINTEFDEGTPSITENGRFMFYTYSSPDANLPTAAKIYVSRRINGIWSIGRNIDLAPDYSASQFAHPEVSPSGEYLYFISDMPGGYGGMDIWRAKVTNDFEPLYLENLGPTINTSGDEMFPYLRNDTTLYFSSDGHPGMGGLDIFVASTTSNSDVWDVQNVKPPINSSYDDFGITFERNSEKGFFSSNRNDIRGYDHIYSFEFTDKSISVEGIVVDHEDMFISGATVLVVGSDGLKRSFTTNKDGEYSFEGKAGNNYLLLATVDGFIDLKHSLYIDSNVSDTLYYVDFEMIPYNKPVVLENIFYDFDSALLKEESKGELDVLVNILIENPSIVIELKAHADRWGGEEYNNNLSIKRANSVKEYLLNQRINQERIITIAVGKSEPKKVTSSIANKYDFLIEGDVLSEDRIKMFSAEQQEIADQVNRRTEFRIVEF